MEVRRLNEMKKVLFDKDWAETARNLKLYYMYRGVKKRNGLRYDITVIPARMLGKEFVKTKGNCNSKCFPELYTVLSGKAIFLMQKMAGKKIKDAVAIEAKRGESVIVPPKYYVVTVNPSGKDLKAGNWVSEKNKNIYKTMEDKKGACYYYTKSGWTKNKNYATIPALRHKKPLKKLPKDLDFLYGKNASRTN